MLELEKVIIVEGRSDRKKVEHLINEQLEIICTNGTLGIEKLEELIEQYELDDKDIYILVDEDESGIKLRKQLNKELPHAQNLFVDKSYREVATTPNNILASVLVSANISIHPHFLKGQFE
ncbi:toprim domain protein [Salirhabdus euzebyi]|uniref:Toprim domain protein n=1 Tax=Salirhabdus euzebyi TaxID=394506 RepID=A0A841Q503_9BACI|nr:toprim domain-containing protein [Salirhabdus euzebyi]MBB6453468.1 toprim domain protein [Salirhabdus euzebyi]